MKFQKVLTECDGGSIAGSGATGDADVMGMPVKIPTKKNKKGYKKTIVTTPINIRGIKI